jgi:hypothetical protein
MKLVLDLFRFRISDFDVSDTKPIYSTTIVLVLLVKIFRYNSLLVIYI